MLIGAFTGVVLFLAGFFTGGKLALPQKKYEPGDDLAVTPYDSKKEREAKLEQQYQNLMTYDGRDKRYAED